MEIKGVTNSVVEYLRSKIITGELAAGQRLNENDLASRLDVSRPPLREAFRVLENEYLVGSIPRKRTYVTTLSVEDLQEVYEAREMIECYAIELLKAKNIRDLSKVDSALDRASKLSVPPNDDSEQCLNYLEIFADYHVKLVESAGNCRLIHCYQAISSNLARYQFMYLRIPGARESSLKEHRQVLNFIEKGDYDRAKEYLKSHINRTFELLRSRIVQNPITEPT